MDEPVVAAPWHEMVRSIFSVTGHLVRVEGPNANAFLLAPT